MAKDEILSRLLSDISDEFDKDVGSFFYDVTKPTSEEFETAYARLEEILKNGFALTASGGRRGVQGRESERLQNRNSRGYMAASPRKSRQCRGCGGCRGRQ